MVTNYVFSIPRFPECVDLLESGQVKVKSLISKQFPLDKVEEALKLVETGDPDVIKILIRCQSSDFYDNIEKQWNNETTRKSKR